MKKQTKKAPAKAKAPARKPTQLDRIERLVEKVGQAFIDHGRYVQTSLNRLEAAIPIYPLDTPKPQGLQPGDYTDASKETADALTEMGFKWYDTDRSKLAYIQWGSFIEHRGMMVNKDGEGSVMVPSSEFLARAAVTAKELGLEPVKVEAWVPKVNDAVRYKDDGGITKMGHGVVTKMHKGPITGRLSASVNFESTHNDFWVDDLRPATDAEITAHLAKLEAAKPVEFGTWVECEGERWRVACDKVDEWNNWMLAQDAVATWKKRQFFTVLDPQP